MVITVPAKGYGTDLKLLRDMREVLLTRGWIQNNYVDFHTNAVCLIGARNVVLCGHPSDVTLISIEDQVQSEYAVKNAVFLYEKNRKNVISRFNDISIVTWNDRKSRTKEEVIQMLDDEIARLSEV